MLLGIGQQRPVVRTVCDVLCHELTAQEQERIETEKIILIKERDKLCQDIDDLDNKIFKVSEKIKIYDCDSKKHFENSDYYIQYKIMKSINETFHIHKINMECFTINKFINPYFPISKRFQKAFKLSHSKEIRIVFHGTDKCNIDDILRGGLDPSLRTRQAYGPGEYFGKDHQTSLRYCKGSNIILIFAIINDKDGITIDIDDPPHNPGEKILVINKIEYQLPIGFITL
jgi:hypothetical protein